MGRKKPLDFLEQLSPRVGILKLVVVAFQSDELDLLAGTLQGVLLDLALLDRNSRILIAVQK